MMALADEPNRVLVLTPAGVAGLAVVRLRGPGVDGWLARYFSRAVLPGRCVHGELRDGDGVVIDDPVVVRCEPSTVDVTLHGGRWVVTATLELARQNGFAVEQQPSLPLPAAAVDGTDRIETEMLQFLPLARTQQAVRFLLAQPAAWKQLQVRMACGQIRATELGGIATNRSLHWLLALPTVAIIGPANVGKSTLANQLFGQTRSITADVPGTTRDWVGEIANLDGLAVMLIDTPGRRATEDPIEAAAIAASDEPVHRADLVVIVLDGSAPLPDLARDLLQAYPGAMHVANRSDRPPAWDRQSIDAIETVGIQPGGAGRLSFEIRRHFQCDDLEPDRARCWTDRQRLLLSAGARETP